ncbi:hypothetical protein [Erwinia phage Snitter]|nr:hypothetical protein [Erwinia phage Snitter]
MAYDQYDMEKDARALVFEFNAQRYALAVPNVPFEPPVGIWLQYDFIPAETLSVGLSRKCRSLKALVQVSIVFPPDTGIDKAGALAKELAEFCYDGRIVGQSYIFTGGDVRPIQKSETGWFIPVRFALSYLS